MAQTFTDLLADRFTFHAVDIARFEAHLHTKTLQSLKDLEASLVEDLNRLDPTATTQQRRRLEALQRATRANIAEAYSGIKREHRRDLIQLAETVGDGTVDTVNKAAKVSLLNVGLPAESLKALADDATVQGAPAREWWSRQAGSMQQRFTDQVREGTLRGEPLSQIVSRVRGNREFDFKDGVMEVSRREAEALVRTSVQSIANAARLEVLQANPDAIKGWQALAVLDARTTELCQARSGFAWNQDGTPMTPDTTIDFPGPPPWHFNCRTVLIPVTFSWEELAQNKDLGKQVQKEVNALPKSTQASMDGQVAEDLNYEGWLKTKPEAFQKDVLGDAKWQLWQEGKLSLRDMIDQKGRPLTILELKDRLVGPPPTGQWQPSMTEDEADAFVKDSVVKDETFYHHTSPEAAQQILENGFRPGGGSIYGRGVYFTKSPNGLDTGSRGAKLTGEGAIVTAKLKVQKVFTTTTPGRFFNQLSQMGATTDELQDATAFLQRRGYDAIRIIRGNGKADFFNVFDKKNIAAIKPRVTPIEPAKPIPKPIPKPTAPPPPPPPAPPAPPPAAPPKPAPARPRKAPAQDTPPAKPWTKTTPGYVWHEASHADSPDYVKRAIGKLEPIKLMTTTTEDASYNPGRRRINMNVRYRTSNPDHQAVWRHEYGHHIDNVLGNGQYISATRAWEADWKKDADHILEHAGRRRTVTLEVERAERRAEELVQQMKNIEFREGGTAKDNWVREVFSQAGLNYEDWWGMITQGTKTTKIRTAALRVLAAYQEGVLTSDVLEIFGKFNTRQQGLNFMDAIGAITKNKVGFGHGLPYYEAAYNRQGAEAFANVFSMLSHPNPAWTQMAERFLPRLTRRVKGALENV